MSGFLLVEVDDSLGKARSVAGTDFFGTYAFALAEVSGVMVSRETGYTRVIVERKGQPTVNMRTRVEPSVVLEQLKK